MMMRNFLQKRWHGFWVGICFFLCTSAVAAADDNQIVHVTPYDMQVFDQAIETLYKTLPQTGDIKTRVNSISQAFIGKPYLLGALGEGPQGDYDQNPLYRTDAFDCMTYVSTVLALAFADSLNTFVEMQKKIQYHKGKVDYHKRHHFTNIDWNTSNIKLGIIRDVTRQLHDTNGKSLAVSSRTWIDERSWYAQKKMNDLKLLTVPGYLKSKILLIELQSESNRVNNQYSHLYYIPLSVLFDSQGNPRDAIFNQIPDASVIEIARPDWDLRKEIGTRLDVSHLGFAFTSPKGVIFRHASNTTQEVTELKLSDYLKDYLKSPTVKGISIYEVIQPPH